MNVCEVCLSEHAGNGPLCIDCIAWRTYWDALTEAQRESELAAMSAYTDSRLLEPGQ